MRARSRSLARFLRQSTLRSLGLVLAVPLSIGVAVPSIQWCSVGWDQVEPACFAECTASPHRACMGSGGERPCSSAREESPGVDGGRVASCPMRPNKSGEPRPSCADDRETAEGVPGEADPVHPARGRAYCLDDPSGTTAPRPTPAFSLDPHALAAVLPVAAEVEAPSERRGPPPPGIARPPSRAWKPIPPARAPPAERST